MKQDTALMEVKMVLQAKCTSAIEIKGPKMHQNMAFDQPDPCGSLLNLLGVVDMEIHSKGTQRAFCGIGGTKLSQVPLCARPMALN